jgi:transcriptional regulator with XRE-family HTH domain
MRLREIRLDSGLTARDLGRLMGRHPSKISRIEHGGATPSVADIRTWCMQCGVPDRIDDLVASMRAVEGMFVEWHRIERTGLRQEQESLGPLFQRTRRFRAYSSWIIPGVLQTRAYTTSVLRAIRKWHDLPDDVDEAVALRMDRQRILREGDHRFAFLIEESVLRAGVAGTVPMVEQLQHLIDVSRLSRVSVGIVPTRPDRTAWPVEDFWILDDAQVAVEMVSGCLTITQPREIAMYSDTFARLAESAVCGDAARSLIHAAADSF